VASIQKIIHQSGRTSWQARWREQIAKTRHSQTIPLCARCSSPSTTSQGAAALAERGMSPSIERPHGSAGANGCFKTPVGSDTGGSPWKFEKRGNPMEVTLPPPATKRWPGVESQRRSRWRNVAGCANSSCRRVVIFIACSFESLRPHHKSSSAAPDCYICL
jgi:hypothetical protein